MSSIAREFLDQHGLSLAITLIVIVAYWLLDRFSTPRIIESADHSRLKLSSVSRGVYAARSLFGLVALLVLLGVWGVNLHSLVLFATTSLTLLGAALFASWSVLSNVTAYFILLFDPQFQRGNFVRVLDLDNYIEGYIADLTLLKIKLITERREIVMYPNNLILSRPVVINPRERLAGIGKLGDGPAAAESLARSEKPAEGAAEGLTEARQR
ncbi:MAG: mechanosensitive ion channel [Burkholderiaceae bacterium]